jgi:multidrug resistance efflux pump
MKVAFARRVSPAASHRRWLRASEARIEGKVIEVAAGTSGRVGRVLVTDNQLVQKGQQLVTLDPRDLDREIDKARADLTRAIARLAAVPSAAIANARKRYVLARLQRFNAEVCAPMKGRVLTTAVRPGDWVAAEEPLVSMVDPDDLWVMARFEPPDFAGLRLGQRAKVSVGERHFDATVSGFVTADDPVLLELDTRAHPALRPGMNVAATVSTDAGDRMFPWQVLGADVCD